MVEEWSTNESDSGSDKGMGPSGIPYLQKGNFRALSGYEGLLGHQEKGDKVLDAQLNTDWKIVHKLQEQLDCEMAIAAQLCKKYKWLAQKLEGSQDKGTQWATTDVSDRSKTPLELGIRSRLP